MSGVEAIGWRDDVSSLEHTPEQLSHECRVLTCLFGQFFGTKEQPNKPARSAVQVAALVAPGALLEIEVIAAKRRGTARLKPSHP